MNRSAAAPYAAGDGSQTSGDLRVLAVEHLGQVVAGHEPGPDEADPDRVVGARSISHGADASGVGG